MNTYDFEGRVAVVTGGGQGIGYTVAKRILDSGGKVSVWDINQSLLDDLGKNLGDCTFDTTRSHNSDWLGTAFIVAV